MERKYYSVKSCTGWILWLIKKRYLFYQYFVCVYFQILIKDELFDNNRLVSWESLVKSTDFYRPVRQTALLGESVRSATCTGSQVNEVTGSNSTIQPSPRYSPRKHGVWFFYVNNVFTNLIKSWKLRLIGEPTNSN